MPGEPILTQDFCAEAESPASVPFRLGVIVRRYRCGRLEAERGPRYSLGMAGGESDAG
jgi:hypothetical protein